MAKKKKENKKMIFLSRFIIMLLTILSIILFGMIFFLKVVPDKYFYPVLCIYFFFLFIGGIFQWNKRIHIAIKSFFNFISIIFIIIDSLGIYYLWNTYNFMDKIIASNYQVINYYVIVLNDSAYNDISDINGLTLGTYSTKEEYIDTLNKLDDKIDFIEEEYTNFIDVTEDLLNQNIDALFMNSIDKDLADEEVEGFSESVKILDTISIKVKNEVIIKDVDVTTESFNIYISGIDVYGDISSVSRSDVNMIVTVNPVTHQVLLTSIPRDYYVRLHGTTGYKDKLTHSGIYGIDMSITTLEDLLDMDINYYVRVNFTTLVNVVNAIDGIDVYSDASFTAHTNKNCTYKKGTNHLNGACALAFARERYAYASGDRHRVLNQQAVLTAILNKTLSSKTLITKYTGILNSMGNSFQTNMPQNSITSLVNMQLNKMPSWTINNYSLDGIGKRAYTYSYSASTLYVMEPDYSTVEEAKNLIYEVMESE